MDEKLLTILGLHSLDKETLKFLKYALCELNGNEGAKILTSNCTHTLPIDGEKFAGL
jgi:hypothetical protein